MTGEEWRDDVLRLEAFEAANPEAEITCDLSQVNAWRGVLPGTGRFAARTLERLLDQMEPAAVTAAVSALRAELGGRYRIWHDNGMYRAQRAGDGEPFSVPAAATLREILLKDTAEAGDRP